MTDESYNENEARKQPGVKRIYRNDQIAVSWEPKLCIHAGNCFRGLPEVFKPQSRPWILVDAGTADKIAEVVMTCPTGALHFERLDGRPQESPPEETTIQARPDMARCTSGVEMRITGPGGRLIREDTRLRYAGAVTLRINLFATGVIAGSASEPRNVLKVWTRLLHERVPGYHACVLPPIAIYSLSHRRVAWSVLAASIIFSSFVVVFQLRMVMLW